ncbi:MAG: bifunctional nuclease family protein [Candidatus Kapabacteria bacterium]|nr:bifunctional nuclease family protein [Ignavibacteriota bacterium]MCW5884681.1 bifunctional nuclease family protein [Candidatus Kapabacteria bacterium]
MEKVQLIVLGLSASPASNNAYALILKEVDGDRRLPIIIGAFEAQAIALEMEGVVPPRPMTHDLLRNFIDSFGATLSEIDINDMVDGTFYAKLIFDTHGIELDARPSDAIALAVRCNAPIYVSSDILDQTGLIPQGEDPQTGEQFAEDEDMKFLRQESKTGTGMKPKNKLENIQLELEKAIKDENYEKAASLRDELKKLTDNQ